MSDNEDLRQITVDTYNRSASQLVEYFAGIGSRVLDIDRAFELTGNLKNPNILEIGCGDGRDAVEICRRTQNYTGMDISHELIKVAQERVSSTSFVVADMVGYEFPENLDIVFAFASLLHLNKTEIQSVFEQGRHLKSGGIFYVSLKFREAYAEELKEDKFGKRLFYTTTLNLLQNLRAMTTKLPIPGIIPLETQNGLK